MVNDALASLDAEVEAIYVDFGRPQIAPEWLMRASLIQILFSIQSERQLTEQMQYDLMFHSPPWSFVNSSGHGRVGTPWYSRDQCRHPGLLTILT